MWEGCHHTQQPITLHRPSPSAGHFHTPSLIPREHARATGSGMSPSGAAAVGIQHPARPRHPLDQRRAPLRLRPVVFDRAVVAERAQLAALLRQMPPRLRRCPRARPRHRPRLRPAARSISPPAAHPAPRPARYRCRSASRAPDTPPAGHTLSGIEPIVPYPLASTYVKKHTSPRGPSRSCRSPLRRCGPGSSARRLAIGTEGGLSESSFWLPPYPQRLTFSTTGMIPTAHRIKRDSDFTMRPGALW